MFRKKQKYFEVQTNEKIVDYTLAEKNILKSKFAIKLVFALQLALMLVCREVVAQQKINGLLAAGPMVGYSTMREVMLWVQTKQAAKVKISYKIVGSNEEFYTNEVTTQPDSAFVAKLIADRLEPSNRYEYKLFINNTEAKFNYPLKFQSQTLWQHRTDPPDFTFAIGSCAYFNDSLYDRPGKPYGGGYEIYESISSKNPDFMLWLGDNDYLREADWDSWTGIKYRYSHGRAYSQLQPLLAKTHNYAIWDDHDFGSNDADRSYAQKDMTLKAFKLFWGNPSYGTKNQEGIFSSFQWGDAEFFLLDNRYNRTPNNALTVKKEILGEVQINWLRDKLISSEAKFKFIVIGGQVLNSVAKYENYSTFPDERNVLLNMVAAEKIKGVIFLSGDRHFTEMSKMDREVYSLFEITCSPLNSTARGDSTENNIYRIKDTWVCERNYITVGIVGSGKNRSVEIKCFNTTGSLLWSKEIAQKEIGYK